MSLSNGIKNAASPVGRFEPLYQQVAARLREEVLSGRYAVGDTLPTVRQIAERFSVSQQTVREALARLKAAGLVSSRRRGGTRVEAVHLDKSGYVTQSIQELLAYGDSVRLKVTGKDWISARTETAELLQCTPGEHWLRVSGHRHVGDDPKPRVYLEVYINRAYPRVFEAVTGRTKVIFRMFEELYGLQIMEFRQEIRTIALTGAAAKTLGVVEGSLGMRYVNRFVGDTGEVLQVSINIHPLDEGQGAVVRPAVRPKL